MDVVETGMRRYVVMLHVCFGFGTKSNGGSGPGSIRPATTFVEVQGFIDREWLVGGGGGLCCTPARHFDHQEECGVHAFLVPKRHLDEAFGFLNFCVRDLGAQSRHGTH